MEATVATREVPPEPVALHDGVVEATRSAEELFQWSGYVHVGGGAEECEHRLDGKCEHRPQIDQATGTLGGHFHAWVCLPNQFQIRDIGDKARAAKARKTRTLRDAGDPATGRAPSDSYVTLEMELDDLCRDHYEELLKAIARGNVEKQLEEIVAELRDDERFEHQAQDAEEFRRLAALPDDERDSEEYARLEEDLRAYGETFEKIVREREQREEERLRTRNADEVVEIERRARIEQIATEAYLHTYYTWSMYVGAREPTTTGLPSVRKFKDPADLHNAPPEVIIALREKIRDLEQRTTVRGDAAGNS